MSKKILIFTITALLCISATAPKAGTVLQGVFILESKEVTAGSNFTLTLKLAGNSENITSLRIPVVFDQEYLSCAYVDFNGTLLATGMQASYVHTADGIEIAYIPPVVSPLPAFSEDSGLIATLHMTVSAAAPAGISVFDAVNRDESFEQFGTTFHRWTRPEMANDEGVHTLLPSFVPGVLTIMRPTDVADEESNLLPDEFILNQNYPNPFNPSTTISFSLPQKSKVRLEVFNITGQRVAVLAEGELPAGAHDIEWRAENAPSGIYFYKLTTEQSSFTKKMLLVK